MTFSAGVGARIGISGVLECKDKDGNVLQLIEMNGSIPLSDLGLSVEQAQELITQQEASRGSDDCK